MEPPKNNSIEKKLLDFIDFKEIPSLPEAAKFAISSSLSNNKSMNDIAKIINQNPSLTLKILKIANSAYYSRKNDVSNIKDALVLLGYKTIKSISKILRIMPNAAVVVPFPLPV